MMPFSAFDPTAIKLEAETHTYRLTNQPNKTLQSCTAFIGQFFPKFDQQATAEKLVNTPKYQHQTVDEILATWQQSADFGTQVHEEIERAILATADQTPLQTPADTRESEIPTPEIETEQAQYALNWIARYLPKSRYIIQPELMIFSEPLGLAGTIDLLAFDTQTDRYIIVDWKTNKTIRKQSYQGATGNHPASAHLMDCNYIKYSLQLSLYRYLLETTYGLNVHKQGLVHLQPEGFESISCQYLQADINALLKHR